METALQTVTRRCTKCGVELILFDTWSEGSKRNRSYLCRGCNAAKGRAFYAKDPQHVIDVSRKRRNDDLEKVRSYWRKYRDENRSAVNLYHRDYQMARDKEIEGRAKRIIARTSALAKHRGIEFDISQDWLAAKLAAGKCEVTGIEFEFTRLPRGERKSRTPPFAPSLDRIEQGGPYTEANCRVVVFIYNVARSDFEDADLMKLAKALTASA
jgi:hypothetical protein